MCIPSLVLYTGQWPLPVILKDLGPLLGTPPDGCLGSPVMNNQSPPFSPLHRHWKLSPINSQPTLPGLSCESTLPTSEDSEAWCRGQGIGDLGTSWCLRCQVSAFWVHSHSLLPVFVQRSFQSALGFRRVVLKLQWSHRPDHIWSLTSTRVGSNSYFHFINELITAQGD